MLYPELFKQLEAVRWSMDADIPWSSFEADKLSEEQKRWIADNHDLLHLPFSIAKIHKARATTA